MLKAAFGGIKVWYVSRGSLSDYMDAFGPALYVSTGKIMPYLWLHSRQFFLAHLQGYIFNIISIENILNEWKHDFYETFTDVSCRGMQIFHIEYNMIKLEIDNIGLSVTIFCHLNDIFF